MELRLRFGVLALLLWLAVAGSDATSSRSAEEYWRSIWPHSSLPKNLEYLLGSGENDAENKDTQYPYTSFFEDDLHTGKQMTMIFNSPDAHVLEEDSEKSVSPQQWGVVKWKRNAMNEDFEKSPSSQQWGVVNWKRNTMNEGFDKSVSHQPWGVIRWKRNMMNEDTEKTVSPQQWGVVKWKRNTMNEDSEKSVSRQPWGVIRWKRNTMNEDPEKLVSHQPWGVFKWKRNAMNEDSEKSVSHQPWGVIRWKRNIINEDSEKSVSHQPWGVFKWEKNTRNENPEKSVTPQPTMVNDPQNLSLEAICNVKERFVGEDDKFCAESVESLLDFVVSKLGNNIEALTSSFVPHQTQYKILEGIQRVSSEGVMCHKLNFEKPMFYCHQVNATITYMVPMEAANGMRTSIVALCHRDTRGLDPHKLFHELKVKPGTVPVCHFLGSGAISWVPRNNGLKAAY